MLYENTLLRLLQKKDQKSQFAEYIEICIFKYCDVTYTTTVNEIMRESEMKIMNYKMTGISFETTHTLHVGTITTSIKSSSLKRK